MADEAARAAEDQKKLVEKMVRAKLQQLEMTMQQHKTPNAVSDQLGASGEVDAETMARAEARRAEHELKQQKRKLKRQKQKQRRSERAKGDYISIVIFSLYRLTEYFINFNALIN